jgi:ATP-binding cassette subfamily B protein
MLKEEVPRGVRTLLENQQLNGVPVLLSTTSDLSLAGEARDHWIVVTHENLAVVDVAGEPSLVDHVPIKSAAQFRAQGAIGSGLLQAYVDDTWIDVARYSNTLATRFHQLADRLEELRKTGEVTAQAETASSTHCPQCNLKLPVAGEACPRCLPRMAIMARLWQMVKPQWPTALGMCGLMLVGVVIELAPPKLQQYLVDDILTNGTKTPDAHSFLKMLLMVVLALAATRVLLGVVSWLKGLLANKVGVALTFDLRSQLVRKLHALGVGYYDRHQVGSLVSRVAHDSEVLHSLLQQITGGFLLQIVQVVAVGVMLFTLNPKLALYTLIPAPLVVGGSLFFWRRVYPNYYRYWDSNHKQAGRLSGMLSGIRVVKAFAQESREFESFQQTSESLRQSRTSVERATTSFTAIMALVFSLGGLIVWYVGGRDVLAGEMTLGSLMAFLAYLAMFYAPLSTLSQLTTWLTSFMTGCQRVFELIDTPVETRDAESPRRLEHATGEIRFENVSFGYERHRPVLKDVSFTIRPGEKIGIVGRSGSGKTTLVNLISRFYDVDAGRVLLDGVDIRQLATSDLRQHVGVVLQEPFLFRGTILDNLIYGRPEATADEAIHAALAAQAHDFILRTPLGYDTWLGERGAGLSGGERQRMSIARALLYDPKVLVLDEATSSVDTESEKAIQESLQVLTRGRTTLAIAHRLSTLRNSDRILVFDQGRLIEQGSHDELMRLDGTYARLVRIQTQVARNKQFEAALNGLALEETVVEDEPAASSDCEPALIGTRWLEAAATQLRRGSRQTLEVTLSDGSVHRGVFAVQCFPASRPDEFISLRTWDRDGQEHELGIVRRLAAWSAEAQSLIRVALSRRYLLRRIEAIDEIKLDHGYLNFRVRTDQGPSGFTMRWTQTQVQDFGVRGKVLVDLEDNRFLVHDVEALPQGQRDLFQRFVYW